MGIDPSRIKPTKITFKGVIRGVEACCTASITLEVVFGSPDNFRSEELIFNIVPFRSGYHALLGRTAFARFNAVPHYAYLKLKMPGPRGVITVNGNRERSLRTEEHTVALAAEAQSSLSRKSTSSAFQNPDTSKSKLRNNIKTSISLVIVWLGPRWGPHCYAISERVRRSCCRLLRARLTVSGRLIAGLENCLDRLLCTSAARAAVCSSIWSERSVFPLTVITPRGPGILSLRYA